MNYNVIVITEADLPGDPAFIHPFKVNKFDDLEVAVGEAIAEWRRYNFNCDFLEASCAVLVEKALLTGSVQARADEMSWDRGYQKQAAATLACR